MKQTTRDAYLLTAEHAVQIDQKLERTDRRLTGVIDAGVGVMRKIDQVTDRLEQKHPLLGKAAGYGLAAAAVLGVSAVTGFGFLTAAAIVLVPVMAPLAALVAATWMRDGVRQERSTLKSIIQYQDAEKARANTVVSSVEPATAMPVMGAPNAKVQSPIGAISVDTKPRPTQP